MTHQEEHERLCDIAIEAIPGEQPNWIPWAEANVMMPSSARSRNFKAAISPWIIEPVTRFLHDPYTRTVTLMKPVQSAGSVAGEVALSYSIVFKRGMLQYNWSNDKRARERWDSRIEAILKANPQIAEKMDQSQLVTKGDIDFGNVFFRMQGAFIADNLDSDSVPIQINEEVHSWEPGHLKKARGRQTAVWNAKAFDISNAGMKGDQLDKAFWSGTAQFWEVKCPGCGLYHRMRIKWDKDKPQLGGLRYDADGCRRGRFEYDYNKLRPTIRYQMPCGFEVHGDDIRTRRQLSAAARYSEPTNPGAELSSRSYTFEAVSVDYIDWMGLIREKHEALQARALGDPEPFKRYVQERECNSYDPEDAPGGGVVEVTTGLQKDRQGLDEPRLRLFALDRQAGSAGELPHWWYLVRDVKWNEQRGVLQSRLIAEGREDDDEALVQTLKNLGCFMHMGVADSGDDTTHVYLFCMKHGINAIKGGRDDFYSHPNGARRIFSPERPIHLMINRPPMFPYIEVASDSGPQRLPDPREPMFWLYSKGGIRERLHWMRTSTMFETPEDVSDDYKSHMEAEQRVEKRNPADGSRGWAWIQEKKRNDLFVCEAYVSMQVDQAGMIMGEVAKIETENKTK